MIAPKLMKKWIGLFFLLEFLLMSSSGFGFSFTTTTTPETCSGNGTISVTVSNADSNGSLLFFIYKLPNTTSPVSVIATNFISGLSSGSYLIIAKETVGSQVTTQQVQATIVNNKVPLQFSTDVINQACTATSSILINTITGTAVSYEIISGPVTYPSQTTNSFNNLPIGNYLVRVFDNCGNGIVRSVDVVFNTAGYDVTPPILVSSQPASCSNAIINQTVTPAEGTIISYPLNIKYVLHLPSGSNQIITNTVTAGNDLSLDISQTIPLFSNQNYNFDVSVSDLCGTISNATFSTQQNIIVSGRKMLVTCGSFYLNIKIANFTPPFSIVFNNAPSGFNPSSFNPNYPNSFTTSTIDFGDITNPVPSGTYDFTILDSCGKTASKSIDVSDILPVPVARITSNGCASNTSNVKIGIPGYLITTAQIIAAPVSFQNALPFDINPIDANGVVNVYSLPVGSYVFQVTDNCNHPLDPVIININPFSNLGLTKATRPGCDLQKGGIKIASNNSALTQVFITNAPNGFPFTLPYDVSSNIANDGIFYMNNLAQGNYSFTCIDACGFVNVLSNYTINGFVISNGYNAFQTNCGSFNVLLNFVSNAQSPTFWLQKLINPATNTWGNPNNNNIYTEGTVANSSNGIRLYNNTTNYNFSYNGTFRILTQFKSYNNGSEINSGMVTSSEKLCNLVLSSSLNFTEVLQIVDYFKTPCSNSSSPDLVIQATGKLPIQYRIVDALGNIILDNGTSNVFSNLTPAVYTFEITDACNGVVKRIIDIANAVSLVTITQPKDLVKCQSVVNNSNVIFDLTQQTATIMGNQPLNEYTLSYHTLPNDATTGLNPILNPSTFLSNTNPQTIYVRLKYNSLPDCYQTTSFKLYQGEKPKVNLNSSYETCSEAPIILDASTANLSSTTYLWSTGETTSSIAYYQFGLNLITATAINSYGNNVCSTSKDITIKYSQVPILDRVEIDDWSVNGNSITIFTANQGNFEYSLDDINYSDSNVFQNIPAGVYTIYIRDKFGCGAIADEVSVLNYTHFFTPNGDGYNDTWEIKNSNLESNFKIKIFDRFGRLVFESTEENTSWDGTFQGALQPASDYWFIIERQNGKTHRGHFSLKR